MPRAAVTLRQTWAVGKIPKGRNMSTVYMGTNMQGDTAGLGLGWV